MRTHINVVDAKQGESVFGIKTGQLLRVTKETNCFIYVETHKDSISTSGYWKGQRVLEIKISKKTGLACHWGNKSSSPIFEVDIAA